MSYPKYRKRSSADGTTTSLFIINSSEEIGKIKANDVYYMWAGPHSTETENQIINSTVEITEEEWLNATYDLEVMANWRVGATPIIRAH